ncbi:MAG: GDSL-type esterase/lipase family protein [Myxococcota bacterium]
MTRVGPNDPTISSLSSAVGSPDEAGTDGEVALAGTEYAFPVLGDHTATSPAPGPTLLAPDAAPVVRSRLELPDDPVSARAVAADYLNGPAGRAFVNSNASFVYVSGEPSPRHDVIRAIQTFLFDDLIEWDGALGPGTSRALAVQQGGSAVINAATVRAVLAEQFEAIPSRDRGSIDAFRALASDELPQGVRIVRDERVLVIGDSHVDGLANLALRDRLASLGADVTYLEQPGAQTLHFASPNASPDAPAFADLFERYEATLAASEYDHVIVSLGTNDEVWFGKFEGSEEELAAYETRARTVINMARANEGSPNVFWIGGPRLPEAGPERVGRLGVRARSAIRDGVTGIDGAYYFASHGQPLPLQEEGADVHPTNTGYSEWGHAFMDWVTGG